MQILLIEQDGIDPAVSLHSDLEAEGLEIRVAHTPDGAVEKTLAFWPSFVVLNSAQRLNLTDFQEALDETELGIPTVVVDRENCPDVHSNNQIILVDLSQSNSLSQGIEQAVSQQKDRFLRLPDFTIDFFKGNLLRSGHVYRLTPKEFKLLRFFVRNKNQVLKRKTIMQEIWETDYMGDTRTLDVHIRWVREKIEENPSKPRYLITIRGVGYRFITNPE